MERLKIKDTLVTMAMLLATGLAETWFDKFGMKHLLKDKLDRMEAYKPVYYIVEADPVHNYGLDFNIFVMYEADGIKFFKQLEYNSAITSQGLRRVTFIGDGVVEYSKEAYSKDPDNRKALRMHSEAGWIFG